MESSQRNLNHWHIWIPYIFTTHTTKLILKLKNGYFNQQLVHVISLILSSWEPSSWKKRSWLSTSHLVTCDNGVDFPTDRSCINLPSPHESDTTEYFPYPAWRGEYKNILQSNTCPIDNILAIVSSNKTTRINRNYTQWDCYRIFELVADCKFENYETLLLRKLVWKLS